MDIAKNINILRYRLFPYHKYYSQCGEDIIAWSYLSQKCGDKVFYLDIGANDPRLRSNTYYFYKNNYGRGILVEPNSDLCSRIHRYRKEDIILNCGVGSKGGMLTYYRFRSHTLNTFSVEDVDRYNESGIKVKDTVQIKVIPINDIMKQYGCPDFLSIDVEGMDFEIIKAIDYEEYSPRLICIETFAFGGGRREDFDDISRFLCEKGYCIYADTNLNTLYARS